mmetsp:Transcript_49867/g.154235  ORF Transcript_49867/g.154235 Transcript_49867/m.154235 type:complete len:98 (-) Transcript_49867:233-526(-)
MAGNVYWWLSMLVHGGLPGAPRLFSLTLMLSATACIAGEVFRHRTRDLGADVLAARNAPGPPPASRPGLGRSRPCWALVQPHQLGILTSGRHACGAA